MPTRLCLHKLNKMQSQKISRTLSFPARPRTALWLTEYLELSRKIPLPQHLDSGIEHMRS